MSKWIYKNTPDNSARFVLGEPGEYNLVCFGINPSTAEPGSLDNTLKTVKAISIKKGFDGWIMLNVYPQRATNPNDMHQEMNRDIHDQNLQHIQDIFEMENVTLWAAFGTLINKRKYLKNCLIDIAKAANGYDREWVTIGRKSKDGHPHHPLYLGHAEPIEPFNMKNYLGLR